MGKRLTGDEGGKIFLMEDGLEVLVMRELVMEEEDGRDINSDGV